MYKGIDISAWQGDIDYDKLKVDFVIIRAGHGQKTIDKKFKRNIEECNRRGIPCGVYWFSYALNPDMARKEAKACLTAIAPYKIEYPVCFDFEYDSVTYAAKKGVKVTKQLASDIARAFLSEIEAAGYRAMNYTNLDFSKRYFDDQVMKKYDIWAARYTSKETDIAVNAGLWQYSSKGKVVGIKGNVDMDISHKDYPALIKIKGHTTSANTPKDAPALLFARDSYKIPEMYKCVFDAQYYLDRYDDLKEAIGADGNKLFEHFQRYGMREARVANEEFDVTKYRAAYKDLDDAYGDDWTAYYIHYILAGKQEIADGKRGCFN